MNAYGDAFAWLADPGHWPGPDGIAVRVGEHLAYTGLTLLIALVLALPAGLLIGHTGRGAALVIPFTGALRALPTLGLVIVLALGLGIGLLAPLVALVILALPPILAGAYAGLGSVDRATVEAARAVGMTGWQLLWQVEVPLALPLIVAGVRAACLQLIATWTVAAYLAVGGLGRFIYDALPVRDYAQMLAGSILVIVLALLADGLFAIVQRLLTPAGLRARRAGEPRRRSRLPQPVAGPSAP